MSAANNTPRCYDPIIPVGDIILAAWVLARFCPYNVFYFTMERMIKLWIGQDTRRDIELFEEHQRAIITRHFLRWKNGWCPSRLNKKLWNARVFEAVRRRLKPSNN